MALVRLKRSKDEEPLSGQEVLDMRQEIRDQNDQYRAARQAVTDHYASGGAPYDLPDSTALASQKAVIGGHVGQPKYVTDPTNPDNWERWSDEYKRLTGQIVDDTPPLTQSLEAATGNIPKPPRPTDEMYMDALNSKPLVDADHNTPAEEPAQEEQSAGIRYGADGYPETGGQYDLSQYTPEQIDAAKNTLIRAWNARNPVRSTVIDMNKGSVWTNASDPRDVWADALMGVPYEGAKKNADGTYSIPSTAGRQPSAEWAAEFLRNGGVIGEYGNQTPYGGGTPGSSSTNVTNNYYGSGGTGASPYSEGGGIPGTSYGPVTAWNGDGRPNFSWELNADPLYQMYREMYLKNGRQASDDAMARAAALTGGYGNSYAQAVGTQAYQQWADKLNDVALKLYDTAYSRYRDDMGDYWKQYGYDYQRERDAINDARYEDETAYNRAWNENEREYTRGRQSVIDQRAANDYYLRQVDYDNTQKQAANNWAVNFASLFGSEEELLGALRNQYASTVDDAVLEQIARDAFNGTAKLQGEQETTNKQKAYGDALNTASSLAKSYYSEDQIAEKLTALYGSNLSNEQIRNIAADAVNAFSTQQSVSAASKQTATTKPTVYSRTDMDSVVKSVKEYSAAGDDQGLYNFLSYSAANGYISEEYANQLWNQYRVGGSSSTYGKQQNGNTSSTTAPLNGYDKIINDTFKYNPNASAEYMKSVLLSNNASEEEADYILDQYYDSHYEIDPNSFSDDARVQKWARANAFSMSQGGPPDYSLNGQWYDDISILTNALDEAVQRGELTIGDKWAILNGELNVDVPADAIMRRKVYGGRKGASQSDAGDVTGGGTQPETGNGLAGFSDDMKMSDYKTADEKMAALAEKYKKAKGSDKSAVEQEMYSYLESVKHMLNQTAWERLGRTYIPDFDPEYNFIGPKKKYN